jgi:hypothetical protein
VTALSSGIGVGIGSATGADASFSLLRFFSSFLMNALMVILRLLFGLQSSAESGE